MEHLRQFSGETESEIWQQIAADMQAHNELLEYNAQVNQQNHQIFFDIDIDLGGGFEGGFETTTFLAPVNNPAVKFHLYPENWLHEVGKILGLEDVELGYPELDKAFIIKSDQAGILKTLFADETIRKTLLKYPECELKLSHEHHDPNSPNMLTFLLDVALTNPEDLREIYGMMFRILEKLEKPELSKTETL